MPRRKSRSPQTADGAGTVIAGAPEEDGAQHEGASPKPRQKRRSSKKSSWDDIAETEVRDGLWGVASVVSAILKSDAELAPEEFSTIGAASLGLAKRLPWFRFMLILAVPFAVIGQGRAIVLKIRNGMPKREKQQPQERAAG